MPFATPTLRRSAAARGARAPTRTAACSSSSASTSGSRRPPTRWPSMFSAALTGIGLVVTPMRLPDVLQARVDLGALVGLVDHAAHLVADHVAGHEDAAEAADVERAGEDLVVAGVEPEPVDRREVRVVGLLDVVDALDLRQLGQEVVGEVEDDARGDVVEDDRLVGRPGDLLVVAAQAAPVGLVVVRGDREDRVGAQRGRALGHVAGVARVVGAGAGDDRRALGALAGGELDEPQVLLVGERRRLAGRPADDEAVGAVAREVAP